ncbi:DUF1302 family protein [Azohydromonas sediminis]|uniref:DUF1302 family protein n=1 Tax=Azohydromonas sediminis TaxID=2259674 RepID=UPI0013C2D5A0|nr:DUF1302 family protein [Azohydromonas sediminis]
MTEQIRSRLEVAQTERNAERPARQPAARTGLRYGVDDLLLEGGALPDAPEADVLGSVRASAFVLWQPDRTWEWRAGVRLDGATQSGDAADFTRWRADYGDTYVRWRRGDTRLTLGAQTIVWGRVDAVPLIDRVSRVDLTRFLLDDLPQRRRAQLAARWEQTWEALKLDAVALPVFRGAEMPHLASVWSPINLFSGEIVGIAPSPALAAIVTNAVVDSDASTRGNGGGAVRLTRTGDAFDAGLTLARTRPSLPYYRFDALTPSLKAVHPLQNFGGIDAEWSDGSVTWRTELGFTSDVPVTRADTSMAKAHALEWVGAVEFFPGGRDTRVNLQVVARRVRIDGSILELKRYVGVNGEIASSFAQERWRAALRFAAGLNVRDVYLGPKLSFVGWEPHEIYLAGHFFSGEARTLGGFHRDHDSVLLGWRTRF